MGTTTDTREGTSEQVTVRCQFCMAWNRVEAARIRDKPKCGKCAKPVLLDRPLKLDDDSFERTIAETDLPVVVDFYADWCAPCKMMAPVIDALAAKYSGGALVAKLDTDHAPLTAERFAIRGIPTVIVFQRGKEVAKQSGVMQLPALEQLLLRACGPGA